MNYYVIQNRNRQRCGWFASVETATQWIIATQRHYTQNGIVPPSYSVYYAGCPDAVAVL